MPAGPAVDRELCPPWCTRVDHTDYPDEHVSTPVQVMHSTGRTVVQLEATAHRPPMVVVSHWGVTADPDVPPGDPDELLFLDLASAAGLAAAVVSLIGLELGPPR